MGRAKRIIYKQAVYHVMARGNGRKRIFIDDADRVAFLSTMAETAQRYHFRWRCYALMMTHYHGYLQTPFENLSEGMRHLNGQFARAWNRRRGSRGHVFGEPFVSKPVEDARYTVAALKYIAWNPVDAGYVANPLDWPWSSCRATAGLEPGPAFLDLQWLKSTFGEPTLPAAQRAYLETIGTPLLPNEKRHYYNRIVCGSEEFEDEVRKQLGSTMYRMLVPRSYRALGRPSLEHIFRAAGEDLDDRNRAIRRAQIVYGYRQSEIARSLNLHPNTISKIVSQLRKQRFFLVRPRASSQ